MKKSIGRIVMLLSRSICNDVRYVIEPFGLTVGEESYFIALAHEDGLTQDELSSRVNVDKSATARAVKSLEAKGYIEREIDPFDRRNKKLYFTEKAKKVYISLSEALGKYNQQLTNEWTDEQYNLIYESLEMLQLKLEIRKNKPNH
ncbi:MarR family transcriptional regulator [Clostridium sp. MD294]|uniref:MarR family winged helix-turn-helix transcriptional regulator n=1 Tax=Clostridium sp. MD294 TaxID=97138 RepID=UPI0002CA760B|nr:MarR family transcriptional regulator [Clostridium sp. MD294]NDO47825.1 MarR family transcriptional regulator [Clostridium sp. MD294]USF29854.1 hypothetical protein C820_001262 [Clostridium sp. MD294]